MRSPRYRIRPKSISMIEGYPLTRSEVRLPPTSNAAIRRSQLRGLLLIQASIWHAPFMPTRAERVWFALEAAKYRAASRNAKLRDFVRFTLRNAWRSLRYVVTGKWT